jgi:hypothetical protein
MSQESGFLPFKGASGNGSTLSRSRLNRPRLQRHHLSDLAHLRPRGETFKRRRDDGVDFEGTTGRFVEFSRATAPRALQSVRASSDTIKEIDRCDACVFPLPGRLSWRRSGNEARRKLGVSRQSAARPALIVGQGPMKARADRSQIAFGRFAWIALCVFAVASMLMAERGRADYEDQTCLARCLVSCGKICTGGTKTKGSAWENAAGTTLIASPPVEEREVRLRSARLAPTGVAHARRAELCAQAVA